MGLAYMRRDPFYRRFSIHWTGPRWPILRELFGLGIPMSLSYTLEATSFTVITLLAARLGTTVMGGHQVVANLAAVCFMVPLSLSIATATLTAQSIGAGDGTRARHTAVTGLRMGGVAAAVTVALLWTLRGASCGSTRATRSGGDGVHADSVPGRVPLLRRPPDGGDVRAARVQGRPGPDGGACRRALGDRRGRRLSGGVPRRLGALVGDLWDDG